MEDTNCSSANLKESDQPRSLSIVNETPSHTGKHSDGDQNFAIQAFGGSYLSPSPDNDYDDYEDEDTNSTDSLDRELERELDRELDNIIEENMRQIDDELQRQIDEQMNEAFQKQMDKYFEDSLKKDQDSFILPKELVLSNTEDMDVICEGLSHIALGKDSTSERSNSSAAEIDLTIRNVIKKYQESAGAESSLK